MKYIRIHVYEYQEWMFASNLPHQINHTLTHTLKSSLCLFGALSWF